MEVYGRAEVELDYSQQVQIEDYFCVVHSEWLLSRSISYADCRATNNMVCVRVCVSIHMTSGL